MGVRHRRAGPKRQTVKETFLSWLTTRLRLLMVAVAWACLCVPVSALNVKQLEPSEADTLHAILSALQAPITAKQQNGTAPLLTWQELYEPLAPEHRVFLEAFRALRAETLGAISHFFQEPPIEYDLVPVGTQTIRTRDVSSPLDPQYLPRNVYEAYRRMMDAMERDLGKRLLVESGYRSSAYQLYLFLYYLPKHDHSITETNRFVALPGYSEHGCVPRQAIDFINQEGVNGEDHPEEFEALPEYAWLTQHASAFGFALSYPRDNPFHTSFEPWHWHFESSH